MGVEKAGIFSGNVYYQPGPPKTEKSETPKEVVDVKAKQPATTEMGRDLLNASYYPNITLKGGTTPTFASLENPNSVVLKSFDTAYERGDFGKGEGIDPEFAEGWRVLTACATMSPESRTRIEKSMALWTV